MKAARVHAFGEGLRIDEVPEPEPGPDEVLVELRAISVNPLDVWVTEGTVFGGQQRLPFIPGIEAAGEAEGRRVRVAGLGLGVAQDGLYRERIAVPRSCLGEVPAGVDFDQAAAAGVAGVTAKQVIEDVAKVGRGEVVVVLGASGGVGSLAVQLAKAAGARVLAETGSPGKAAYIAALGADEVLDVSTKPLEELVAERTEGRGADAIVDPLGGPYTAAAVRALAPRGRVVVLGASAGPTAEIELAPFYRKGAAILTYSGLAAPDEVKARVLERVLEDIAAGRLRVPIDARLPLEEAAEAHRRIRRREICGKLILEPR